MYFKSIGKQSIIKQPVPQPIVAARLPSSPYAFPPETVVLALLRLTDHVAPQDPEKIAMRRLCRNIKSYLFQLLTLHFEVNVDFVKFSLILRRVKQTLTLLHKVDSQLEVEVFLLQASDLFLALPHCELCLEGGPVTVQGVTTTVHLQGSEDEMALQYKIGSVPAYT